MRLKIILDFATRWVLFEPWVHCWETLGYTTKLVPVNSAHLSGPGNPAAPQLRERLLFIYLDTFEPFGPVLALEKLLRAVQLGRVVSVLEASQCRGQAPELLVS
jgi:hypothetical protein